MRRALLLLLVAPLNLAAKPKAPAEPPPPPAPDVRLEVAPSDDEGATFGLRVVNHAEVPVRLRADARLLRLTIEPPPEGEASDAAPAAKAPKARARKTSKPKSTTCALPGDMLPTSGEAPRELVLPPGGSWSESFDPALYCFVEHDRKALAAGGTLVARLGFAPPKPTARARKPMAPRGRFVAVADDDAATSPIAELVSPSVSIAAAPAPAAPDEPSSDDSPLRVEGPARTDATSARAATATVVVRNASSSTLLASLRRDRIAFDVDGPGGKTRCAATTPAKRGLSRDLFTTLAPHGARSFDVWLHEVCPKRAFDVVGLYSVTPSISATDGGERFGLAGWTGTAQRATPILLRLRTAKRPFYAKPAALDAAK